ncbi:N-acetylmuramoyl-L-alanine amidase [Rhodovulum bhavnagarense]|uniref:N-acetylmuramoyl-L-alanine amidase n=1 Tax=Rhodovulum bhavnagarense TaxID=992286 RepID=A0A4R2RST8_9RHOB|nr:N-acetylmuramoyl-L-alanine amidase [Rhodovulum bhavnagarense]TCP62951.1 N-acetylmuramoyl-L-alanine amidase [Rhodovulum bhavnagarense]
MGAIWRPSPNHGARRGGARPDMVVVHYTGMVDMAAALARLCDPEAEVSAHYLIARDGRLFQLVSEERRAWHAGVGCWGMLDDVNSHSIGIELDNDGATPFAAPLMARLETVLQTIMRRWAIPPARVIAHSDMAPGRKADPGRRFDWQRLARQGLAVWPSAGPRLVPDAVAFAAEATRFGYGMAWAPEAVLDAFRQRFRPAMRGPLDSVDMALMSDLARRFPVDQGLAAP